MAARELELRLDEFQHAAAADKEASMQQAARDAANEAVALCTEQADADVARLQEEHQLDLTELNEQRRQAQGRLRAESAVELEAALEAGRGAAERTLQAQLEEAYVEKETAIQQAVAAAEEREILRGAEATEAAVQAACQQARVQPRSI